MFATEAYFTVNNGRRNYHPGLNEHCSFVTGEEFLVRQPPGVASTRSALFASGGFYGGEGGTHIIMVDGTCTDTHVMRQTFITAQYH